MQFTKNATQISSQVYLLLIITAVCTIFASTANAETIYSNTYWDLNYDNYYHYFSDGPEWQMADYGVSDGGNVTEFTFVYVTSVEYPGTVTVRFYNSTSSLIYPANNFLLATFTFNNLQGSTDGNLDVFIKTYQIPTAQQFTLNEGSFGYSLECTNWDVYFLMARGGTGNENSYWSYHPLVSFWELYGRCPYAGFYMEIFSAPAAPDPLATVSGYKFDDTNANGVWDAGEDDIPGWRIYLDENDNGVWDTDEPNDITDPNGFYEFKDIPTPATVTVAEVMQDGWTQTLPGGAETYTISLSDGDNITNKNFGNTDTPVVTGVTISGYVTLSNDSGLSGVSIQAIGTSSMGTLTDNNGYFEFTFDSGWSGTVSASKTGWVPGDPVTFTNITTDQTHDFSAYWPYSGGDGTQANPYHISTDGDLNAIGAHEEDWDKFFEMTADIDMSAYTGTQFNIIGTDSSNPFTGVFDGNDHTISNFTYTTSEQTSNIGLFGYIYGPSAEIKNLGIIDPVVISNSTTGINKIGSLAGYIAQGRIENCYAQNCFVSSKTNGVGGLAGGSQAVISKCYTTGNISGNDYVGGLIGSQANSNSLTTESYSEATVSGNENVGGLVGQLCCSGEITKSNSNSTVSGNNYTGGLVGSVSDGATVSKSYSLGTVTGNGITGGLTGSLSGTVSSSFSKCDVTVFHSSGIYSGGLVGTFYSGTVENCYSAGSVTEDNALVGGLVGQYTCGCYIINCYSIAEISYPVGGLVASDNGCLSPQECTDSFWDKQASTANWSDDGIGKTTLQMIQKATYTNWDFDNVWRICDGMNYPRLMWEGFVPGDIDCPDGVGIEDFAELSRQWQLSVLDGDVEPDGIINLSEWYLFAAAWQTISTDGGYDERFDLSPETADGVIDSDDLAVFAGMWLMAGAHSAELADGVGDRSVDMLDWAVFAGAWQSVTGETNFDERCDLADPAGYIDTNDLAVFASQWLTTGNSPADIAPVNINTVGYEDLEVIAENWLMGR